MKYYAKCAVRFKYSNALKCMTWTLGVENFGKYDFQLLGNPISGDPANMAVLGNPISGDPTNMAVMYMRWNWLIKNWKTRRAGRSVDGLYTQLAIALSGAEN